MDFIQMSIKYRIVAGATASVPRPRPRRVLCYGDSLTAGLVRRKRAAVSDASLDPVQRRAHNLGLPIDFDVSFHPYAWRLAERLGVPVDHVGVCGATSAELLGKAERTTVIKDGFRSHPHEAGPGIVTMLSQAAEIGESYDTVVLLSGTNDLGGRTTADEIARYVRQLHALCRSNGVTTTALLTVPASNVDDEHRAETGEEEPRRAIVNSALRALCAEERTMVLVDLALPPNASRLEIDTSNYDGLHLTAAGYDALGEIVADCLFR